MKSEGKNPWFAVFLTRLFPGLGHLYLKKWFAGIVIALIFSVVQFTEGPSLIFYGLLVFVLGVIAHVIYCTDKEYFKTKKIIIAFMLIFAGLGIIRGFSGDYLKNHVVDSYVIVGGSMEPTIQPLDQVLAWKMSPENVSRGDIIVFNWHDRVSIKRIAGLPGETIEIRSGKLFVDNTIVNDAPFSQLVYSSEGTNAIEGRPFLVPAGMVFLLGDGLTRGDSRFDGPVEISQIIGKAYKIYWPPEREQSLIGR